MKCSEVIQCLEERTPHSFAMEWDNVGLLVGRVESEIHKILVTLDVTKEAVTMAVEQGVDMIVSHHPILFSSVKSVTDQDFLGNKIVTLIEHGISCFAMHTNYDVCQMADLADQYFQMTDTIPLEVTYDMNGEQKGIGSVAHLAEPISLSACAKKVKDAFGLKEVLLFGKEEQMVQRIAMSPGSGRHMIEEALKANADVLITGDIGHHEGLDALDMGISVIEAGHHGLEQIFISDVADYLKKHCKNCEIISLNPGIPYQVY
ncbi:MAG: Nif3-like dinuclear metal center hexameric protein [Anaerostipes sp.]|jgi:dinuclear metal center YbgI/SA1388 family protein